MTGRTAFIDGLLAKVFLNCKANARRSVYSSRYHLIILSLADRPDTWDKWPLARNRDRSWWYRHTGLKFFWPQPMIPWTTDYFKIYGYVFHDFFKSPSPSLMCFVSLRTTFGGKKPRLRQRWSNSLNRRSPS